MKERGILFTGNMVLACLAGTKTQTRRAVTPSNIRFFDPERGNIQPDEELLKAAFERAQDFHAFDGIVAWKAKAFDYQAPATLTQWQAHSTYGTIGDRLWARENFRLTKNADGLKPSIFDTATHWDPPVLVHYEADGPAPEGFGRKIRPAIHMPRSACRLVLEIVEVRAERLKDISRADALAEGITELAPPDKNDGAQHWGIRGLIDEMTPQRAYMKLWGAINGFESVEANPWVWVVVFKRVPAIPPKETSHER